LLKKLTLAIFFIRMINFLPFQIMILLSYHILLSLYNCNFRKEKIINGDKRNL